MMKKYQLALLASVVSASMLAGCAGTTQVSKPLWADEPLLSASECNNLTAENITSFLVKYGTTSSLGLSASSRDLMEKYTFSSALINRANSCMAQALDLKEVVAQLDIERKILLSGTSLSSEEMDKHRAISASASDEIRSRAEQSGELGDEQKNNFTIGIVAYLGGIYETAGMREEVQKVATDMASAASGNVMASGFSMASTLIGGGSALYTVASGFPDHGKKIYNTAEFLIDYSQSNDIDLPADATNQFGDVGGW